MNAIIRLRIYCLLISLLLICKSLIYLFWSASQICKSVAYAKCISFTQRSNCNLLKLPLCPLLLRLCDFGFDFRSFVATSNEPSIKISSNSAHRHPNYNEIKSRYDLSRLPYTQIYNPYGVRLCLVLPCCCLSFILAHAVARKVTKNKTAKNDNIISIQSRVISGSTTSTVARCRSQPIQMGGALQLKSMF